MIKFTRLYRGQRTGEVQSATLYVNPDAITSLSESEGEFSGETDLFVNQGVGWQVTVAGSPETLARAIASCNPHTKGTLVDCTIAEDPS